MNILSISLNYSFFIIIIQTIQNTLNYGMNAGYFFFAFIIAAILTVNIKFIRCYL